MSNVDEGPAAGSPGRRFLPRIFGRDKDPYWDFFINSRPVDPANLVAASLSGLTEGRVFPVKAELHSPDVTASQVKELATFLGATACGIVELRRPSEGLTSEPDLPFSVVCVVRAEYDPKQALGIGGQAPALTAGFVAFLVSAYIRELGYEGTRVGSEHGEALAVAAGLGVLDAHGRLRASKRGSFLHVADVIRSNLPLKADAEVVSPWLPTS